jgi:hypothetical protein
MRQNLLGWVWLPDDLMKSYPRKLIPASYQ